MQPDTKINCPVCGRSNAAQSERCTFCGSSLRDAAQFSPEGRDQGISQDMRHASSTGPYIPTPPTSAPYPGAGPLPMPTPYYAGFWIRVFAYAIDSLIIHGLTGIIAFVSHLGYVAGSGGHSLFGDFASFVFETNYNLFVSAFIGMSLVYFTFFLARSGRTPGKRICRLKVIRADGGDITMAQALLRTVCLLITLFVFSPATLWVAIDRRKQGIHDKIAATFEIRLVTDRVGGWTPPPGTI